MPKAIMRSITAFCFAAAIIINRLYFYFDREIYLALGITFGTTAYHFGMRLLVGLLYDTIMKNQADYTRKWYQVHSYEEKLYHFLNVKKWKSKIPAYHPEYFSIKRHSWHEIAQAMCQAELVHETNMLFSFLPLIAAKWFGSFYVFLITSICGAIVDLPFVIVQRYNRMRIINFVNTKAAKT